jgi:hypothetical protein
MNIDKSNYEIWLIDWLDGNLSNQQVDQVRIFLDQNPDLREEFNDSASLLTDSPDLSYRHKQNLRKSPSEIPASQFDYLCIAFLENDLTASQKAELLEIVSKYPDKRRTFELIQKTRLPLKETVFKNKRRLHRRTVFQKAISLSLIGVSAAAAISVFVLLFTDRPGVTGPNPAGTAQVIMPDSSLMKEVPPEANTKAPNETRAVPAEKKIVVPLQSTSNKNYQAAESRVPAQGHDSSAVRVDDQRLAVNKVTIHPQVELTEGLIAGNLIASNPPNIISDTGDERGGVGKFISKTFREKILKEKAPADKPLKAIEVAEAGVNGLNKLLGWQMVLDMTSDANGQPRSVYFSSKLVKVNAPVKKKEAQP